MEEIRFRICRPEIRCSNVEIRAEKGWLDRFIKEAE
jgi:hypothetical protein